MKKKKKRSRKGQKITPHAQVKIKKQQFEKLCRMHCTQEEIAQFFEVSVDTIERWIKEKYNAKFAEVFDRFRGAGKVSLRRKQWQVAMRGNVKMLMFLGKNCLEQKDKVDHALGGYNGGTITIVWGDGKTPCKPLR